MAGKINFKVWDMCHQAQKLLSMGYCSMLTKSGDFQYSYRLWLEDNDGWEQPITDPIVPIGTSTQQFVASPQFYKDLVKKSPRVRSFWREKLIGEGDKVF